MFRWFQPEFHYDDLMQSATEFSGRVARTLSVVDLFGASRKIAKTWHRAGYNAWSYDIKLAPEHDLTSRGGFELLMNSLRVA